MIFYALLFAYLLRRGIIIFVIIIHSHHQSDEEKSFEWRAACVHIESASASTFYTFYFVAICCVSPRAVL